MAVPEEVTTTMCISPCLGLRESGVDTVGGTWGGGNSKMPRAGDGWVWPHQRFLVLITKLFTLLAIYPE